LQVTQEKHKFLVVGLGEILWDILPAGKQLGGAPANFAYHAQAIGSEAVVVSRVGEDTLGKEILTRLGELGLECGYIQTDREHPTGTVTVELDEQGKPAYNIHEDVAWDFIGAEVALLDFASRADAVCFGSLCQRHRVSRATIREFLSATRQDCIRVFDINLRQSYFYEEIVETMLGVADVLKLNDEELPVVARLVGAKGTEDEVLSDLTARYELRMIALTRGSAGSLLYSGGRSCEHEGYPTEVVDTVGAGDAFSAALTVGLLQGTDVSEINDFANRVASFVCSQPGATPRLPDSLAAVEGSESTK